MPGVLHTSLNCSVAKGNGVKLVARWCREFLVYLKEAVQEECCLREQKTTWGQGCQTVRHLKTNQSSIIMYFYVKSPDLNICKEWNPTVQVYGLQKTWGPLARLWNSWRCDLFKTYSICLSSDGQGWGANFFLIYFIEMQLICSVILVPGVQQSDSVIHTYILLHILYYDLLQDIE